MASSVSLVVSEQVLRPECVSCFLHVEKPKVMLSFLKELLSEFDQIISKASIQIMTTNLWWGHSGKSLEACECHVLKSGQMRPLLLDAIYSRCILRGSHVLRGTWAEHLTSVFHVGPRVIGQDHSRLSFSSFHSLPQTLSLFWLWSQISHPGSRGLGS